MDLSLLFLYCLRCCHWVPGRHRGYDLVPYLFAIELFLLDMFHINYQSAEHCRHGGGFGLLVDDSIVVVENISVPADGIWKKEAAMAAPGRSGWL